MEDGLPAAESKTIQISLPDVCLKGLHHIGNGTRIWAHVPSLFSLCHGQVYFSSRLAPIDARAIPYIFEE